VAALMASRLMARAFAGENIQGSNAGQDERGGNDVHNEFFWIAVLVSASRLNHVLLNSPSQANRRSVGRDSHVADLAFSIIRCAMCMQVVMKRFLD
jgi:hypothetical protein